VLFAPHLRTGFTTDQVTEFRRAVADRNISEIHHEVWKESEPGAEMWFLRGDFRLLLRLFSETSKAVSMKHIKESCANGKDPSAATIANESEERLRLAVAPVAGIIGADDAINGRASELLQVEISKYEARLIATIGRRRSWDSKPMPS
jgi:hypothetical protein